MPQQRRVLTFKDKRFGVKRLLAIGEGMAELREKSGVISHSFAGDTYNMAVYAKRFSKQQSVSFMSSIGVDFLSKGFEKALSEESIETRFIMHSPDKNIGIYAVETDDTGERTFRYWRNDSAAKQMMTLFAQQPELQALLRQQDMVFFSGITLAILDESSRTALLTELKAASKSGTLIAFDPNYRPTLWQDKSTAVKWITSAYEISDIVLPGLEDHEDLYGHTSIEEVRNFVTQMGSKEIVIKAGSGGVYASDISGDTFHQPFVPAPTQVDSTAAGDSFAGTYLAARLALLPIEQAVINACDMAREVVQHPGAIIPVI